MAQDASGAQSVGGAAWSARARAGDWIAALPVWLFASWAALLVLRAHWPYILQPGEQSLDEGYILAIGQRMIHGRWLPYVDGAAHSGPIFLYTGALIAAFGEFSWLPMRIFSALGFALTPILLFACARRAGRPFAGAIAAAGMPFYVTLRMGNLDGISYNAELPAVVLTLVGLYAALRALEDERTVSLPWLVTAGVFAALGALTKQVATTIVLPMFAYVVVQLNARDDRKRNLLAFLAGGLAVVVLVFGRFALAGALRDAYYYMVSYNRFPYMAPYRGQALFEVYTSWMQARPLELALTLVAVAWGFGQLFAAWDRERSLRRAIESSSFDWMAAAMALGGVIGARAARRDYDHYFVMLVPGFSLLVGILLERALTNLQRPRANALYQLLMLVPIMLVGELTVRARTERPYGLSKQTNQFQDLADALRDPPLCQYIRAHSKPGDRLFVWGFRPQVYPSCARVSASRYVFTSFVSGFVPGFEHLNHLQDEEFVVPGSRTILAQELKETRPPVIVESLAMGGRLLRYAGPAWDYIEANYKRDTIIDRDVIYLRNDLVAAPP